MRAYEVVMPNLRGLIVKGYQSVRDVLDRELVFVIFFDTYCLCQSNRVSE